MKPTSNSGATDAELRAQAGAALREKSAARPEGFAAMSPDATRAMLHELQVQQIELELQNEKLRRTQEALRLSDVALKNISQGIIITGLDQLIVSANAAFCQITGYSEQEILGKNCKFLVGPDTDPLTVATIRLAIRNASEFTGEILNYRKDGSTFWNELTISPVRDDAGKLTHFIGVARDVTERKQAAKELSESEMRMRLAIRGGDLGLWDWEVGTGRLTVNEHWLLMLGLDAQTHNPTIEQWHSLVHPDDLPKLDHLFKEVILNPAGCELEVEIRARHQNGNYVWILDKGRVAERAPDGSPLRVVGTHLDITKGKMAEAALLESQNLLLSITENTTDAIFVKDTQGRHLLFNGAACRYVGKPAKVVLGKDDTALFPPDQAREIMEYDRQVISSGLTRTYEGAELTTSVGPITFLSTKGPIRNAQGEVIGIFGISRDITKRKQVEIELLASEARYRTLVEHSPYGIHEIDLAGRLTSMNRAGLRMLGVDDVRSIQGMPYLDAVGDSDRERIASLLAEAFAGQASEFVFQGSNGLFFQSSFVPIADDNGTVQSLMGLTIDITAQKQTEELLLANEAKFRTIIDASPVPMAINDEEMRITFLNPAFVRTFGYDLTDIPTLAEWWPKAYPDPVHRQWVANAWQAELARAAQTRREFTPLELKIRCKDGTDRFVLVTAAPLAAGLEKTHLVLLYDISERKRAEQNLKLAHEAASQAKSEFLANMSHEIRTPLTAILGFADILGDDETVNQSRERRKQTIDTIKNAGTHLLTVINDILDLSKIEADKLTVEKVDTQLVNVLCEVERLMLQTAAGKGLILSMAISSPLPDRILCDPTRLRQILMNLVGNAIKFTAEGTVRITAGVEDQDRQSRLVIDIADTGPGITPEQAHGLFKAFGQADSTVTRRHGGTGLGLVICRRLARIMDGDVTLLYSELGKGSCFRLVMPFEQVEGSTWISNLTHFQAEAETKPDAVALKLRGRVLLAEDGLDNQRLIAFVMRKAGATVETADNGRIALDMLDQAEAAGTPFDLLLTDMQMPEMDGYNLASTLRERGSKLPIVALTAHAMSNDRQKCIDAGCDDYLTKPINKVDLIAKCAEWMGRPSGVFPPVS